MSFWKNEPKQTYKRVVTRPCACGSEKFTDSGRVIGMVYCNKCGLMYSVTAWSVEDPIVTYKLIDEDAENTP